MKVKQGNSAESVKVFSDNHNKQKIVLKSYGKPHNESRAIFEARLTRGELKAVCDFITKNFTDDGKK